MLNDGAWDIYIRNGSYYRIHHLSDFTSFEAVERHLSAGKWTLELPGDSHGASLFLNTPNVGIYVTDPNGRIAFSGPLMNWHWEKSRTTGDLLTVEGWDDFTLLALREIHPQPQTVSPPFATAANDTQGPASLTTILWNFINRNIGPGAQVARRHPGLTLTAAPVGAESIVGPTLPEVSGGWNEENLIEFIAPIAGTRGASVTARHHEPDPTPGVRVTVRMSRDRSSLVEVSPRAGTLEEWSMSWSAPTMTHGWVAGAGEGTARPVVQGGITTPHPQWTRRREKFIDFRSANDLGELSRKLDEELVAGAAQTSMTIVPDESVARGYGDTFDLGDKVRVSLLGASTSETVTSASLRIDASGAVRTIGVGPQQYRGTAAFFQALRQDRSRMRNLEGI